MGNFSKNSMAQILHESQTWTLGTLAAKDVISTTSLIDAAKENGFRILRTEWWASLRGVANAEGPILIGMAANLSAAEIEITLEANPENSNTASEGHNANRPVWPLAVLENDGNGGHKASDRGILKPSWSIPEGSFVTWFAWNLDSSTLTTGGSVTIYAKHFGVWLKD